MLCTLHHKLQLLFLVRYLAKLKFTPMRFLTLLDKLLLLYNLKAT